MNLSWGLFSNVCNDCVPNLFSFMLIFGVIAAIAFWIYKLVTFDWTKHDKDEEEGNYDSPF